MHPNQPKISSAKAQELQNQREAREQSRAKWAAFNARSKLQNQGKESVTEYGIKLFNANAETVTIALGLLLEELLANPNKPGPHFAAWPLLLHVTNRGPRTIALIALSVVLDRINQKPEKDHLALSIGAALEDELKAGRIEKSNPTLLRMIKKRRGQKALSNDKILEGLKLDFSGWTATEKKQVGNLLLEIIQANTELMKVTAWNRNGRLKRIIEPTDLVQKVIIANPPRPLPAKCLPSLVKIKDWNPNDKDQKPLVRSRAGIDLSYLTEKDLKHIAQPVSILNKNEKFIDPRMVNIERTAWDEGIKGLFPVVRDPVEAPVKDGYLADDEYKKWVRAKLDAQQDRNKGALDRKRIELDLRQLEEVAGYPCWFSHCLCFRGRIYTSNRYATHQGPDWSKAAINFGKGERCSPSGFDALLMAAANHFGECGEWSERLKWGKENVAEMCAVAKDPLEQVGIWKDAKEPWQYLQMCMAIADQVKDKGSKCAVPIRYDQTSSGIGISAALLRDHRLACLTNITGDKKRDLYEHMADQLQYLLRLDLSNGTRSEQKKAEFWLNFGIDRNLTKIPCMTTIYGAQFLGIVDGLTALLEENDTDLRIEQWEYAYLAPARYLARKLKVLIEKELASCLNLQKWWKDTCKTILSKNKKLRWTNPYGMPIELGSELDTRRNIHTLTRGSAKWTTWNEFSHPDELSARITNRSLMANAIHFMDSGFCMNIICKCAEQNIQLLTNHDCFATTPTQAHRLQQTLCSELKNIYEQDYLGSIRAELIANSGIKGVKEVPCVGTLDVTKIGINSYCFS